MVRGIALVIGLAASLAVEAQQSDAPVRVGSPGVAPLHFVTYAPPNYPQIALSARVSGDVVLEATVDVNGQPQDIRVVRSIPLLDQAAIDAVRSWRFERPTVAGVPSPVRVPITVKFPNAGQARSFSVPVRDIQSPLLPRDYAISFASNCPDGAEQDFNTATGVYEKRLNIVSVRAQLWADLPLLEAVHDVIVKTGLMTDLTRLAQWPDVPPPTPVLMDTGIHVSVPVGREGLPFMLVTDGITPRQYLLEVRMNGMWTRLFPPASWPGLYPKGPIEPRDIELQRGVRRVGRLLEKHVQSILMKRLPRNQQWCSWPD